jgi:membrane-associated phospholipid phosphatase
VVLRVALLLLALTWASFARADENRLKIDWRVDLPLTLAAGALAVATPGPGANVRCGACSTGFDEELRSLLRAEHRGVARRASDLLANAVVPGGVLALSALGAWRDRSATTLLEDALVVGQAVFFAADLTGGAKRLVPRARPDGGAGSFFSSHTSRTFALTTAAATVATLRGRPYARWAWVGGLGLASAVGYFRVAGDAHWASDVLTGAAVGGAVGFAVPWLLHRGFGVRRLRPAVGGVALQH